MANERLEKTVEKAKKKMTRDEKQASKLAAKMERRGHLLRMFEQAPADPDKPKPGEDKPSGARMYMRAFRPKIEKTDSSTNPGGEPAIYEIHMPDHGNSKVYGATPKKAFKSAMKFMATYSKMLEEMMPGGEGAKKPDQGKPKKKPADEEKVRKGHDSMFTHTLPEAGALEFKGA